MIVRSYRLSDWPRLCEIHDASRLDELRLSVGADAFLTLEQTAQSEGLFDGAVAVAEADGVVQGFVAFAGGELNWLYVHPSQYRRGVGRVLLRHAIANAGPMLRVELLEGNEPALALYRSEGFTVVERRAGRLQGNESFAATGLILERRHDEG